MVCAKCGVEKHEDDYYNNKSAKSGKNSVCKSCFSLRSKQSYLLNSTKIRENSRIYYIENKDNISIVNRDRYLRNKENPDFVKEKLEKSRTWKKENPSLVLALDRKRDAQKVQALPKWADKFSLNLLYLKSRRLSLWLGAPFHVDHIIPLQSDFVCGLHCPANLRIIPKKENLVKGNRYWPDMW